MLFLAGDGYCGWATALYLASKGHSVAIVDNFVRRQWDYELGVQTLTPIRPLSERLTVWYQLTGIRIELFVGDVSDYDFLSSTIKTFEPEGRRPLRRTEVGALLNDRSEARGCYPDK